jgi:hypothetical protein
MSMSDNDPRKKNGPMIVRNLEVGNVSGMFNVDWEQSKLEWIEIVAGIRLGGIQLFKPKPDAPRLEDYLREKEARKKAEQLKQAERK